MIKLELVRIRPNQIESVWTKLIKRVSLALKVGAVRPATSVQSGYWTYTLRKLGQGRFQIGSSYYFLLKVTICVSFIYFNPSNEYHEISNWFGELWRPDKKPKLLKMFLRLFQMRQNEALSGQIRASCMTRICFLEGFLDCTVKNMSEIGLKRVWTWLNLI